MFKNQAGMVTIASVLLLAVTSSKLAAQDASHPVHEGPSVSTPADQIQSGTRASRPKRVSCLRDRPTAIYRKAATAPSFACQLASSAQRIRIPRTTTRSLSRVSARTILPVRKPSHFRSDRSGFRRGEESHVTECLSKTECLFFLVQPGKFDFAPAK